jgi:hypothetical protein
MGALLLISCTAHLQTTKFSCLEYFLPVGSTIYTLDASLSGSTILQFDTIMGHFRKSAKH